MTDTPSRLQRWTPLLGALVSVLLIGIAALQYLQWQRFEATLSQGRAGVEWDVFQLQAEHYKLAAKLNETQLIKGQNKSMEQLVLRYQVFLSRFDILRSGAGPRAAFLAPENRALFDVIAAFIVAADPYLGSEDTVPPYNEEKIQQLRTALDAFTPELQQLVINVNAIHGEVTTKNMRALRQQAVVSGVTSFGLALLAVLFGVYALRQQKNAVEKNRSLSALHRELEDALVRAESANRSKADFLANMSHEIRTPMNAVLGMLQLLGNTELKAQQLDYLNKSQSAARSLLGLLNDVLDFSKIDAGKLEIENLPFSTSQLLDDLSVVLAGNVGGKPIEVLYDIGPEVPETLVGDRLRLQQVLINLAGNAVKFTAQGQVVLSMHCKPLSHSSGRTLVEFSVQDSGIGIAPENQSRIFVNFNQAESSTTRRFGGTGLGLAISKSLVELMGGSIQLHSALGQGSTFSFALPLQTVPTAVNTAAVDALSSPAKVLVLDNNPIARDILGRSLSQLGFEAVSASSADDALNLLASYPEAAFRYALLDWQMPGVDGWHAAQLMAESCRSRGVPVPSIIMMSSNGREDLSQRTVQEQAAIHAFLVKPFSPARLGQVLQQYSDVPAGVRRIPRSSKRRLADLRILLVEDNAMNQQVAEELLGAEGAVVSIAADGEQGVNAVASAKQPFDLVLMDVQMPVMDGYEATRHIREKLQLSSLPIIGLTANAMAADRDACIAAGMNEHMGKPFDMTQLVSLIIRLTGHLPADIATEEPATDAAGQGVSQGEFASALRSADMDLATALARMGGLQSLYVRAASDFRALLDSLRADLMARFQEADPKAFATLVHTTKGNAGTLGLLRLSSELARIETLFKDSARRQEVGTLLDGLGPVIEAASAALDAAVVALKGATAASGNEVAVKASGPGAALAKGSVAATPAKLEQARKNLQALTVLLAANDMTALECFALVRESLSILPDLDIDELDYAVHGLDFEAALRLCAR